MGVDAGRRFFFGRRVPEEARQTSGAGGARSRIASLWRVAAVAPRPVQLAALEVGPSEEMAGLCQPPDAEAHKSPVALVGSLVLLQLAATA
jgi:hypothetical protein